MTEYWTLCGVKNSNKWVNVTKEKITWIFARIIFYVKKKHHVKIWLNDEDNLNFDVDFSCIIILLNINVRYHMFIAYGFLGLQHQMDWINK